MPTTKSPVIDLSLYINSSLRDLHKAVHNLAHYGFSKDKIRGEVTKALAEVKL